MSNSIYRGKMITNKTIKEPFTEADDEPRRAVQMLAQKIDDREKPLVFAFSHEGKPLTVLFHYDDFWMEICEDGTLEFGGSGA
jgi:hypothetical protein